jgi:hypothetical protein
MGIITEEPEFEMPGEDPRIPQHKPRYFRGKLDNPFKKFVEVVRRLSINIQYWIPFKYLHILIILKIYLKINMR